MKKAKENWIEEQCSEIEENLRKNNSKRAYQLMKDLTTVKEGKATTVQDRSLDHCERRESYYCPRSFKKMPHRRTRDAEPMHRILL